ncbi:sensor histidine kinase [Aureimonas glaciei]|nr:sensor histidine kinase [Aureimonas glaciei]
MSMMSGSSMIPEGMAVLGSRTLPVPTAAEEADHRIANSLQLVSALIGMEARRAKDPHARAALESTLHRVAAVAGVHRHLHRSTEGAVDLGAYVGELVRQLALGCAGQHVIVVDAAGDRPINVEAGDVSSLGIIVTEVILNACKYAYPAGVSGIVTLSVQRTRGGYKLVVEDKGKGLDGETKGRGLGSRLIASTAERLGASLWWENLRPGTRFVLAVPCC